MTLSEKILARHCGRESVRAGELVMASVDLCLGNDITAPVAIKEFRKAGLRKVFDPAKVVLVPDHFTPNKDIPSAEQAKEVREFAREQEIVHYYEVGRMGIEHALLPELGLVGPGDLVIGADSHTCTYGALGAFSTGVGSTDLAACMASGKVWLKVPETIRFVVNGRLARWVGGKDIILYIIGKIGVDGARYMAMEFVGETIEHLGMDDRFTISNMAIEAGGKAGLIPADATTAAYLAGRRNRPVEFLCSDPDARFAGTVELDASQIEPQVSTPGSPANAVSVRELKGTRIDQVVIGSCTNGRLSDLEVAARLLKGRKVHPSIRLIVIPATQRVYLDAMRLGYLQTFVEAEAVVSTPTCGPCLGGHMGVLAAGEKALATTNRNFIGRMGHSTSGVYLCSPAVAAASAVAGEIVHPDDIA